MTKIHIFFFVSDMAPDTWLLSLTLLSVSRAVWSWSVSGPGLQPQSSVLPCRHFFIRADSSDQDSDSVGVDDVEVSVVGEDDNKRICRAHTEVFQVHSGLFLVRYKLYFTCHDLVVSVKISGEHSHNSPVITGGAAHSDTCNCPRESLSTWISDQCQHVNMSSDLSQWSGGVDMRQVLTQARSVFSQGGSQCWCHYAVSRGHVHRKCYGQHVGFSMFWDSVLSWLARRAVLPDLEIIVNLGDWPLVKNSVKPAVPMISWCGSDDTSDIILPTYELTEASIECMGRQSLDVLGSLGRNTVQWEKKEEKLFWRGRDSNRERLKLVKLGQQHPDLINASITAYFFFREEESRLGKSKHVPFFDFFIHKYQLCIDGTVAAYRLPYLLAGGSLVFKTESKYYEHFYKDLQPWTHYVPVKQDLSDLLEKIKWARNNDDKAGEISKNAQNYAINNLLPDHVLCYYAHFLQQWSHLLTSDVTVDDDMEKVNIDDGDKRFRSCKCEAAKKTPTKDEL